MKISLPMRLTLALLILQALLCVTGIASSDYSYLLWVIGGAGSAILLMIGAVAGPMALFFGIVTKRPNARQCGVTLLVLNTAPLVMLLIAGHLLFGDQFRHRGADGLLKQWSVEPGATSNPRSPSALGADGR